MRDRVTPKPIATAINASPLGVVGTAISAGPDASFFVAKPITTAFTIYDTVLTIATIIDARAGLLIPVCHDNCSLRL